MKMKKTFLSVFLFLCLLLSMSTMASAKWITNPDGSTYYTVNGKNAVGIKTIAKKRYLFDLSGKLITDQVTRYNGKLYVSQKDGSLLTSWGKYKGKNYYPTSKGVLQTGLRKYKNDY